MPPCRPAGSPARVQRQSIPGQSGQGQQRYTRTVYHHRRAYRVSPGADTDVDADVVPEHWVLHGAGHAWSGGHATGSHTDPRGISATQEMLRFFLAHPKQPGTENTAGGQLLIKPCWMPAGEPP